MNHNQRASARISTTVPIALHFPHTTIREGWGRIRNINSSGLLLETRFPLKAASVVYVSFRLSEGIWFSNLRTTVIRVSMEDGYFIAGLAFDEVVDKETMKDVLVSLTSEGVPEEGQIDFK